MRQRYTVRIARHLDEVAPLLAAAADSAGPRLVFQDPRWLRLWYESFAPTGMEPLIVIASLGEGLATPQSLAMVLPLVRRRRYFLPLVEFADRGVTDYNLPVLGPGSPRTAAEMRALLGAITAALRPFAVLRLHKMPAEIDGLLNPFALLEEAGPSRFTAHHLVLPPSADGYLRGFGKKKRTEIERAGRGLDALGANRFGIAETAKDRAAVFALIKAAQRIRVPGKGDPYILENSGYREFYEQLVEAPGASAMTVVSAIWLDGRPVAGLIGVRDASRFVCLRIGVDDAPDIMRLGLGKVLLFNTACWAIGQGLRIFDFSLGGTTLKAWFHPRPMPLIDYASALNGLLPWPRRGATEPVTDPETVAG